MRLMRMHNAAGLDLTLTEDRCLDLYQLSYRGVNLSFLSKNGLSQPPPTALPKESFFDQWPAGMLTTCGLANVGDACVTNAAGTTEHHPTHGRIGLQGARVTRIEDSWSSPCLAAEGTVRECRLYGRELELRRRVEMPQTSAQLSVFDQVVNMAPVEEGIMALYHLNFGYPFLGELTTFSTNLTQQTVLEVETQSRGLSCFSGATEGEEAYVLLENAELRLAVHLSWDPLALPYLYRWRNLVPGDWVVGIEPATCRSLAGRAEADASGDLLTMVPGAIVDLGFRLTIVEGADQIQKLRWELGEDSRAQPVPLVWRDEGAAANQKHPHEQLRVRT